MIVIVQSVCTQNIEYCFDTNNIFHLETAHNPIFSKIKHTCYEDGKENYSFNYVIFSTSEGNYIWKYGDYYNRYLYYAKDTIVISDFVNENYIFGSLSDNRNSEINKSILSKYIFDLCNSLPFLFYNVKGGFVFEKETDTVIDGFGCKLVRYNALAGYEYDFEKQTRGKPLYSHISMFLTKSGDTPLKVIVKEDGLEGFDDVYEIDIDDTNEPRWPEWTKSAFDINSVAFANFTFFDLDKKQIPASEMGKISTDTMTEKLLHYPLVNSRGDTTSLNDFDGWVLLDFWIFGCRPCTEFHKRIQQEREKTGKILFKDMGIDILSIYILGGNTQTFRDYVSAYNIADISYAARDISLVINTPSFPRFFLVSPDKQIVYTTGDLSDNSELLKAKKEFEQKHPVRNEK